jgi:hypothetical protein
MRLARDAGGSTDSTVSAIASFTASSIASSTAPVASAAHSGHTAAAGNEHGCLHADRRSR